jgi:hypothetical protein
LNTNQWICLPGKERTMRNRTIVGLLAATGLLLPARLGAGPASIPWSEIGAKASADYHGDGLDVGPTSHGARLRCIFQRLEGEATSEGLWLSSTAARETVETRFRVIATAMGRAQRGASECRRLAAHQSAPDFETAQLPHTGTVAIDGQTVRFSRPGLVEEYSVSTDGVQQDFVVMERPAGTGELAVRLTVTGARNEPAATGTRLVLDNSGRKLAYSRLRATDATGRELSVRIELLGTKSASGGQDSEMTLAVNDSEAVYPVRIDPTFSDANWVSLGGIPGAQNRNPTSAWLYITAAVVDGSGNLYVGGDFTIIGDTFANHVAKWDGTHWSALGSGVVGSVGALAMSGSNLYVGGSFVTADGLTITKIARWDGSTWSALGYEAPLGVDDQNHVSALAVLGSDLYVGGYFNTAGGIAANNIAKWDGSSWSALGDEPNQGMDSVVLALAVSGNDLYVGGDFSTAGGIAANLVAKWDGSSWSALGSGIGGIVAGGVVPPDVYALGVSGSDLYVGGIFSTAGGIAANSIAKWDGSSWSALGSGVDNAAPNALVVLGTNLYAGGAFTIAGGLGVDSIAKWDGSTWSPLGSGLPSPVNAMVVSGRNLYVGGWRGYYGSPAMTAYIATWDGNSWSSLGSASGGTMTNIDLTIGDYASVNAFAVSGSNLYVGGFFTSVNGIAATNIAKWDGTHWSALGSGLNGSLTALAVSGGDVYAGGWFSRAGGIAATNVAKWNGSSWSALGSGFGGGPYYTALAVSGSNLYAGTGLTNDNLYPAGIVAKWDGSSWAVLGSPPKDGAVYKLVTSGSDLYAELQNSVVKWDGNSWSQLGASMALSYGGLAVYRGNVYAAAYLYSPYNDEYVVKWDGTNWTPEIRGGGLLAVSGNDLYAAGNFTMAGGKVCGFVAKAVLDLSVLGLQMGVPGPGTNLLTLEGVPGSQYITQFATSLSGSSWFTLSTNTAGASGVWTVQDPAAKNAQRFYRGAAP